MLRDLPVRYGFNSDCGIARTPGRARPAIHVAKSVNGFRAVPDL